MATPEDQVRIVYVLTARDLASAKVAAVNQSITRGTGDLNKKLAATDKEAAKAEKSVKGLASESRKADSDIARLSHSLSASNPEFERHGRAIDNVSTRIHSLAASMRNIPQRLNIGITARMVGDDVFARMKSARDDLGKQIKLRFVQSGFDDILVRLHQIKSQSVQFVVRETGLDAVKARLSTLQNRVLSVTARETGFDAIRTKLTALRDKTVAVTSREIGLDVVKARLDGLRDKVVTVTARDHGFDLIQAKIGRFHDRVLNVIGRERGLAGIEARLATIRDRVVRVDVRERGMAGVLARLGLIHDKTVKVNTRVSGLSEAEAGLRAMASDADKLGPSARRAATDVERITKAVAASGSGGSGGGFSKLIADMGKFGRGIPLMPLAIVGGVGALGGPVIGAISNLVGLVGQLSAGLGALGGAWAPAFGAVAAYVPIFASLGVVMGTIAIGSHNMVKAFQGNTAVFKQSAPSMLNFVRQVQGLHDQWIGLVKATQQPLFAGASRALQASQPQRLFATLRGGFAQTATTLGSGAQQTGQFFGQKDTRQRITQTFDSIQPLLTGIAPIGQNLFKIFTNLTIAAAPLAKWLENVVQKFTLFLATSSDAGRQSGRLADFFKRTEEAIKSMWTVASQFGMGLFHILQQGVPLGNRLADSLGKAATNFNRWTQSVQGRIDIANYFKLAGGTIRETAGLLDDLVKGMIKLGANRSVQQFVTILRTQLGPALGKIFESSSSLGPQLATVAADLVKLVAALPISAMQVFTRTLENLIKGVTWLVQNLPAAKIVVGGLVAALAGLATLKFLGLVTGLSKVTGLLGAAREGSLIGALRGPGATAGAAGAAGAAETAAQMEPLTGALTRLTAAVIANTEALLGRGFTSGGSGSTMVLDSKGRRITRGAPVVGEEIAAETAGVGAEAAPIGLLGRAKGFFKSPAGVAGGAALAGGLIATGVGAAVGGSTGSAISTIGGMAASGAAIGSFFPGWGTAIGAAVGGLAGLAISLHHSSSAAQDFAKALTGAAKAGQTHAGAIQAEAEARRNLPTARADVTQSGIAARQARTQRSATMNDLVARFAAARNVNLQTASPQQIAQLRNLAKRTDEYRQAQDNVTYALQQQRDARRQLGADLRTISQAQEKAAHSSNNFHQQIRNVTDDILKSRTSAMQAFRRFGAEGTPNLSASLMRAINTGQVKNPKGAVEWAENQKAVTDYTTKVQALASATKDPAFKHFAQAAVSVAQAMHGIPTIRRIKLALEVAKDTGISLAQAAALVLGKTPKEIKREIKATIKFESKGLPGAIAAQLAAGTLKPGQIEPNVLAAFQRSAQQSKAGTGQTGTGAGDKGKDTTVKAPPALTTGNQQPLSTQAVQNQIDALAAQLAHQQAVIQARITASGIDPNSPKALQLQQQLLATTQGNSKQQIALYQKEIAIAKKMHADPQQILQLRSQIAQLQDAIITNAADMVANARAIIQARFEFAAQQLDMRAQILDAQAQSFGLRAQARPGAAPGLENRAAADIGKEIALLRQEQRKYAAEARDRALSGEVRRQAQLSAANLTNAILQKQLDRQAAIQASYEIPAQRFANSARLSDLRAQGASLMAQIATGGTGAGAQGAVIAAIENEIPKLRKEQREYAKEAHDQRLTAQQRQEAQIKAQEVQNEILQKQLEVEQLMQQQVANALTRVGGSLSFGFNNQQFTDVISSGTGA